MRLARKALVPVAILLLFLSNTAVLKASSQTGSYRGYTDYVLGDLRVVVVLNPRTPSYTINYKGLNFIDYNLSDDYSMKGVEGIPGVNPVRVTGNLTLDELSTALKPFQGIIPFYYSGLSGRMHPMTILHPELGAVEVIVNHNVDALKISKPIALALKPVLTANGYNTLVVVRGFYSPNTTLDKLWEAFDKFSYIVMRLPMNNSANDTPSYLRQITQLQEQAIREHQTKSYISVGLGVYGSIGIDFWGPKPSKTQVCNLVKWIRDKAGHDYSDIPLYIMLHSDPPPHGNGFLITTTNHTATAREPRQTSSSKSHDIVVLTVSRGQALYYSEYWLGGLRVVLVDPWTPDSIMRYKGLNYVDFNTSNNYIALGPRAIPGLNMAGNATPINSTVLSKVIRPIVGYLEYWNVTGDPVGMNYPVIIHRDYSAVEVVVNPDKDPLEASLAIASSLKSFLLGHGYTTLIIIRGLSGTPFTKLLMASKAFRNVLVELVDGNYTGSPPSYLQQLAEKARRSPDREYYSVSPGVFGSVVTDFWGSKPDKTTLHGVVKWLRDNTGTEYSDVPLYIIFHKEQPPKLELRTITVPPRTTTTRPSLSISYQTTGITVTIVLAVALIMVTLKRKY